MTLSLYFFFFNDTATTEIYTLSLHDALPISHPVRDAVAHHPAGRPRDRPGTVRARRSEEHTSELQSQSNLVCRLLLEKKNDYSTFLVSPSFVPTGSTHIAFFSAPTNTSTYP